MRKLILALLFLAIAPAFGFQVKQVRSLSAAAAVTNGGSFSGTNGNPLPPEGDGLQWSVLVSGSSPSLSFQVQAQMTDGTWVPVAPTGTANATIVLSGTLPTNQLYSFFGPFNDMRVAITAYTSGSLTADIFVTFQ